MQTIELIQNYLLILHRNLNEQPKILFVMISKTFLYYVS